MMPLDKEPQNGPQQHRSWKSRLHTWQNSVRKSIRPKKRAPSKSNYLQFSDDENLESHQSEKKIIDSKGNSKDSTTSVQRNDIKHHFWRERKGEGKLSNSDSQQDDTETKSTANGHSMNKKTLTDGRALDKKKFEWRKHRFNNNITEAGKCCSRQENGASVSRIGKDVQSSLNNPQEQHKNDRKSSLRRPKSLSVLTNLFKRSSSPTSTQNTNRKRGNTAENSGFRDLKGDLSSLSPPEDKFVRKCDPGCGNFSSCDSFTDTDLSPRLSNKYYSLKRSRASLIYPRSPTCDKNTRREKARTFCCGEQESILMEKLSAQFQNSDFGLEWNEDRENRREVSRSECFLTRERRAYSDLLHSSISTHGLSHYEMGSEREILQPLRSSSVIGPAYYGYNYSTGSNICSSIPSRGSSNSNIPILGVTLVDNEGNEKTIEPLGNWANCDDADICESPTLNTKPCELGPEMGNTNASAGPVPLRGLLDKGATLKHAKSNPELYRIDKKSSHTLTSLRKVPEGKKKKFFTLLRGFPCRAQNENYDMSSRRSSVESMLNDPRLNTRRRSSQGLDKFGVCVNDDDLVARSLTLTLKNHSLNRSTDCLSIASDSKTKNKLREFEGCDGMSELEGNVHGKEKPTDGVATVTDDQSSEGFVQNEKSSQYLNNNHTCNIPMVIRGSSKSSSRSRQFDDGSQSCSLPSSFEESSLLQNGSLLPEDEMDSPPKYCSTPVEMKQTTLERRRALSYDNSARFVNYNRTHNVENGRKPPYVRPRIQSLEELSPKAVDAIMRKKKSLLKRTRLRHCKSVPNADFSEENLQVIDKRHSYHENPTDFSLPFVSGQKSQSAELLNASQESLVSNSSLSPSELGSRTSFGSEKYLSPPPLPGQLGRSISIPLDDDPSYGDPVVPGRPGSPGSVSPEEGKRNSLSRNPRLGKSTGDLNFEPSGVLKSREIEIEEWKEDMDVPEAFAEALWDHVTMDPEELSFRAGDVITVISMTNVDWWFGQVCDQVGWFPAPFVRVRVSQTLGDEENHLLPPLRSRRGTNEGLLTNDDVRARVVKEILNTERDYVKNLKDVVEGYLRQAQKRVEMFTDDQIYLLFSNIEQIYRFHQRLLSQLKECYVKDDPCNSMIGQVFLENKQGFNIYSEYCNNHPHAIAELKSLCESNNYKHFFEACRLLQDMINISLDGFLLTPVQKICKYPLQLAELLKHTYPTHKDYEPVSQALDTMKEVASLINERKRKVENIYKIAKWQSTIEGLEGENVLERSSELIHSGDVHKISVGTSQERVFFLFDNQLVYCKKDILRKNGLSYKGRIDMNTAHITWLQDREESHKNEPLLNAWKIYNEVKNKWYVVYTKTAEQKERWKKAFTEERRRVHQDAISGFVISRATCRAAMRAANISIKGKKERAAERREKFVRSTPPPSPTLRLPPPVSSADLIREENGDSKADKSAESQLGFLRGTSVLRRSFGLRGSGRSKKHNKEKRMSSAF